MLFLAIAKSSFISALVVVNVSTFACKFVTVALKHNITVINNKLQNTASLNEGHVLISNSSCLLADASLNNWRNINFFNVSSGGEGGEEDTLLGHLERASSKGLNSVFQLHLRMETD
jgi:hypothetical protein